MKQNRSKEAMRMKGGDYGKITLPQVLGVNHWFIISVFIIGALVLFWWFEKKGL